MKILNLTLPEFKIKQKIDKVITYHQPVPQWCEIERAIKVKTDIGLNFNVYRTITDSVWSLADVNPILGRITNRP